MIDSNKTTPFLRIGPVEAYLYGWYIAIVFVPLYRWFVKSG
jgi:hypothetical protein